VGTMSRFVIGLAMVAAGLLLWIVAVKIGTDLGLYISQALNR
jgi:hypothetical protein